jgi:hypothetical protein
VDREHEAGFARGGVGDCVQPPTWDRSNVTGAEHSTLATGAEPDRAGQDLEALESFVREGNMVVFENVTELDGHVLSRTVATHRCRPNGEVKTVTEE